MQKFKLFLVVLALLFIPLYPKFPLFGISGTFVSVRLDDFIVALLVAVLGITVLMQKFSIFRQPVSRAVLLYLLVGTVAAFSGIFLTRTATLNLGLLHTFRRFEYFSLFFVGFTFFNTVTDLPRIIRVILLLSFLVAIYGLGQQFLAFPVITTTNSEFAKGLALTLGAGARINSTFAGHYDLAAFSVFPLLLILSLLPVSRHKPALIGIGLLVYWTMLLSASRITFASLIISASLLVILIRKKIWLIPIAALIIAGFFASPQLRGRYLELITNHIKLSSIVPSVSAQTITESKDVNAVPDALKPSAVPEDRSLNIRLKAEWPAALRSFYKSPLLGTGYSSIGLASDNDYLRALAETGILGLSAFLLIFIRFFKSSWQFILNYQPSVSSSFIISVSCFMVSLLLNAVFIDVFEASKIAIFFWLIVGIAEKIKTQTTYVQT
jgi:hypothetical protein